MKTCIMTLSWLDGPNNIGSGTRLERNERWLDFHQPLLEKLGADSIWMVDNASSYTNLNALGSNIYTEEMIRHTSGKLRPYVNSVRFKEHIPRKSALDYGYCWRGLYFIQELIKLGYEKIILLDTDCYILTKKLTDHVKNLNSGWEVMWCQRHRFPEAAFQIMCKDSFPAYEKFVSIPWETNYNGRMMETLLPYTKVNKDFIGDRYGEIGAPQEPFMDFYAQASNEISLKYET